MKITLLKKIIVLLILVLLHNISFAHFGSKGPFGGSVSCGITNGTATVYIGTPEGGVFESTTTALVAWRARPVGLKSGKITALAHTTTYLFAGTADSGVYILNGYVGSDRYWIKINNGLTNLKIKSLLAIDTITVLVGTDGGGLFKTTNKGASWIAINNSSLNSAVITGMTKAGSRIILTLQSGGVFISDDNGATWADFNDTNTLSVSGTNALSYNATTDELMILNDNGLFVTASASVSTSASYSLVQTGLMGSTEIRFVSNNGSTWFLATNEGVYSSVTAAISWSTANTGLSALAQNVTTVIPFGNDLVLGTNKEGVFKTSASAVNWVAFNASFNNLRTYAMTSMGELAIVTATEKGVFASKDLAASYQRANTGLTDSLNVTDLIFVGSKLFASTKNNGVFFSADSGKLWTSYNSGLASIHITKLFAGGNNLYAFSNDGKVYQANGFGWTFFQTGLPSGVQPTSLIYYNNTLLLSTYGDGIYSRAESATEWTSVNTGLTNLNVTSLTTNGIRLFAGTDGAGVFVSNISSVSWSATSLTSIAHTSMINLNGRKIQAMGYFQGYVYASYKGGLLASSDNGVTWIAGGNQFNLPSYTDVTKISFVTTRVFVTTENNCLYSNALSELPVVDPPVTAIVNSMDANTFVNLHPNPNNGIFKIDYTSVSDKIKEVLIYNASGKLMDSFEADQLDISVEYPKGIYLVVISTVENKVASKKMMVE